jgi:transcriptional regulator with XRE-family HTH domain
MAEFRGKHKKRLEEIESSWEYKLARTANSIALSVNERLSELEMTRSDLAQKLGVDKSAVTQILSGGNNPKLSTLIKLADALELDLNVGMVMPSSENRTEVTSESLALPSHGELERRMAWSAMTVSDSTSMYPGGFDPWRTVDITDTSESLREESVPEKLTQEGVCEL